MDMPIEINSDNKISKIKVKEEVYELRNLREAAKIASIYHRTDRKFQRNKKLSHIVHATLNLVQFALIGCIFGTISMLTAGIMEMKQVDWYIDHYEITDEKLFDHPIFVHSFSMCILSIFIMTFYLIHVWILFDVWQWMTKFGRSSDTSESEYSSYLSTNSEIIEDPSKSFEIEQPGQLDPIPALNKLITKKTPIDSTLPDDEPVILYCCFVDCFNYIKYSRKKKPKHEFQVIHVL
ncbi:PREDICTED: uncharacterized protein LOC107069417 [Polistes dominula]|uniref:Uncharacterized protein LOC107069417 n=1 Tax=Polistes dominula TaxID=743375 RepID=A0ABM1IPR6_POLDO|nr:PREDICTED: uncharacterized protein LOC107069417 [Polistes dominula]